MLVSSAFALGVYVGEHGWNNTAFADQPRDILQPAGQLPPLDQPFPPDIHQSPSGQPIPGLPPGRPQIIGRIRQITPDALELATQTGPRRINLTEQTRYIQQSGESLVLKDLQRGDMVAIYGEVTQQPNQQFKAELVIKLPTLR